jgi:tellurite resistance protein TerC
MILGWTVLAAVLVGACGVDLFAHRGARADPPRRALAWSVAWVGMGLAFGGWVAVTYGARRGEQFLAAYLLEKTLSLDNLLVFFLIFERLAIDPVDQRRILFWGIAGALLTRGAFIGAGVGALERWHPVLYGFGVLLMVLGARTALHPDTSDRPPSIVVWLEKHARLAPGIRRRFFARVSGKVYITPLAVALLAVESSDVLFAVDSIPTAFAVTSSPFILYSSNILAVLGLRALFLVVTRYLAQVRTLRWGIAVVLLLAGGKILISPWIRIAPIYALVAVIVCLTATLLADRWMRRRREPAA